MNTARLGLWIAAAAMLASASCATSTYRIPGAEMQRLAQLNGAERGRLVRVMPVDASTANLGPVPAPPPDPPPADEPDESEDDEPVVIDTDPTLHADIALDVSPGPRSVARVPDHRPIPTVRRTGGPPSVRSSGGGFSPPVVTPVIRAAPIGGGVPLPRGGGFAGRASSPGIARIPAPRVHGGGGHSGGGHSGGGFSGGDAIGALVAVIVIVGLVAIIAEAASEPPPPFDGWAQISPDQPLHLRYRYGTERVIKLRELRPVDLVGLRDTIVMDSEGTLIRLPPDADRLASSPNSAHERMSLSVGQP